MTFSKSEVATYLFCASLPSTKTSALTIIEWNMLVTALANHNMYPEVLLDLTEDELSHILSNSTKAQKERIVKKVMARKQLGIAMVELEDITNQGYNVVFRSQMPKRLKKLELKIRPAFYYSVGDLNILNGKHTLGVVGSRDAIPEELKQVADICKQAALNNVVVISGGAAGVDLTATTAALQNGGKAVIFPSTGITPLIKNKANRQYIQNGQLLIMSTQPINASFTGRYAMERNKFIHSTGDAVLVGASQISGAKSSGTWEGVLENLRAKWSPLYTVGQSTGVLELLKTNKAEVFTSLHNIYPLTEQLRAVFNQRLQTVIDEGIHAGVPVNMIVDVIQKKISSFKDVQQSSTNTKVEDDAPITKENVKQSEIVKPVIVKDEADYNYSPDEKIYVQTIDGTEKQLVENSTAKIDVETPITVIKRKKKMTTKKAATKDDSATSKKAEKKTEKSSQQIELIMEI